MKMAGREMLEQSETMLIKLAGVFQWLNIPSCSIHYCVSETKCSSCRQRQYGNVANLIFSGQCNGGYADDKSVLIVAGQLQSGRGWLTAYSVAAVLSGSAWPLMAGLAFVRK